jgi:hypothetical protein
MPMQRSYAGENRECGKVQPLLSEYLDNTLSGRQVWTVERHLAACAECAALSREMQAAVQLLQAASRYDTGDDFMAKLHARLDAVAPEAARARPRLESVRDGLAGVLEALRNYRAPALGLGMAAMAALSIVLLLPHPTPATVETGGPPSLAPIAAQPLRRNVALAASNPLDDPAAANLEANAALSDSSAAESDNTLN